LITTSEFGGDLSKVLQDFTDYSKHAEKVKNHEDFESILNIAKAYSKK
jgi:hypothetical protein